MKRILLLTISILSTVMAISQEFLMNDSAPLVRGIYRNLEELKNNSPSIPLPYTITKKINKIGVLFKDSEHITYQLSIPENQFYQLGWFFGFCDGRDLYINPEPIKLKRDTEFEKILILKPLSYFERLIITYTGGNPNPMYPSSTIGKKYEIVPYVLDIPSGNISVLTSVLVNEMLLGNDTLKNEIPKSKLKEISQNVFMGTARVTDKTITKNYLLSFYKKDKTCKTSLRDHLGILALVDFIKERPTDSDPMSYYERVFNCLEKNPYFSEVKLVRMNYGNGTCKKIGFVGYHGEVPYYIGIWSYFNSEGKRTKLEEYDLNAKKIRVTKF